MSEILNEIAAKLWAVGCSQTDKHTNTQTDKHTHTRNRKHNLLDFVGGGNNGDTLDVDEVITGLSTHSGSGPGERMKGPIEGASGRARPTYSSGQALKDLPRSPYPLRSRGAGVPTYERVSEEVLEYQIKRRLKGEEEEQE